MTTESPAWWRAATSAQSGSITSVRTSPRASATMLEPSLTTTVAMAERVRGRAGGLVRGAAGEAEVAVLLDQAEDLALGAALVLELGGHRGLVAVDVGLDDPDDLQLGLADLLDLALALADGAVALGQR